MPKKKSKAGNGVRLHDVSDAPLTEAEHLAARQRRGQARAL